MRIFVTGANGFVGSAVVQDLIQAGHQVLGLSRSEAGAKALKDVGAQVHNGTLEDLESLRTGAQAADGVIHTAFKHDFSDFAACCDLDRQAIETLGEVLLGTDRPLLVTSGVAHLAQGRPGTEDDAAPAPSQTLPRQSEIAALKLVEQGVKAAIIRLPFTVHGEGDHGFIPMLIQAARERRISAYIGEGNNLWPAVHRLDAASVYRLALTNIKPGYRYHAVAEIGVPFKTIAEAIGKGLNVPVTSQTAEEAITHFGGFLGHFAAADGSADSQQTQSLLNWQPTHKTLLSDLSEAYYFKEC